MMPAPKRPVAAALAMCAVVSTTWLIMPPSDRHRGVRQVWALDGLPAPDVTAPRATPVVAMALAAPDIGWGEPEPRRDDWAEAVLETPANGDATAPTVDLPPADVPGAPLEIRPVLAPDAPAEAGVDVGYAADDAQAAY